MKYYENRKSTKPKVDYFQQKCLLFLTKKTGLAKKRRMKMHYQSCLTERKGIIQKYSE